MSCLGTAEHTKQVQYNDNDLIACNDVIAYLSSISVAVHRTLCQVERANPFLVVAQQGRFQMKNTKRNSGKRDGRTAQQLRASALRALSKATLQDVKGGDGPPPPPIMPSDPIC
jgi:hypothetical protein